MLWTLLGAFTIQLSSCAEYSQTTRLINGREVTGRPITAQAYAYYLEGSRLEALGRDAEAIAEYRRALDHDSNSVEIQTRIAHLVCKKRYIEGTEEFEAGADLDPQYEPLWRLRARCALAHDAKSQALTWAREALRVAPLEFSATEVLVDVLLEQGQPEEAERLLTGYLSRFPSHRQAWQKLLELSRITGSSYWEHSASVLLTEDAIRRAQLIHPEESSDSESQGFEQLDRAVLAEDLNAARHLADDLRVSPLRLGLRAIELARPRLALAQGSLLMLANPANSDARILVLVAATTLNEKQQFNQALKPPGTELSLPSPDSAEQFAELLSQQLGPRIAALWLEAYDQAQLKAADSEHAEGTSADQVGTANTEAASDSTPEVNPKAPETESASDPPRTTSPQPK